MSKLAGLRRRGFDRSCHVPFTRYFTIACSQCDAMVICGVPTHEQGCPHIPVACRECGQTYLDRSEAFACCREDI